MAHVVNFGGLALMAQTSVIANFWDFGHDRNLKQSQATTKKHKPKKLLPEIPHHDLLSTGRTNEMDKITDLPGLHYDPGFDMYSGYFTVNREHDRNLFYWYVESQGDPSADPVIFWTNGGPGCSGMYAFAVEHGPFFITSKGNLFDNPHSWNKNANILYVESPAGVGYSFSAAR